MNRSPILRVIENNHKFVVSFFFILFLCIGLSVFDDYGISWDERFYHQNGIVVYEYVFQGEDSLEEYSEKEYGAAFELLLVLGEKLFKLEDPRDIFLLRHLLTFLVFYLGVLFFYLLNKFYFNSWKIALLGSVFLVLSPRIFAHSFYNSRDLFALSMFIICMYLLVRYLDKKTWLWAFWLALTSAVLINVRLVGVLIPFLALIFITIDLVAKVNIRKKRKAIFSAVLLVFLLGFFIFLFWPYLWKDPLNRFVQIFKRMTFDIPGYVLNFYRGRYVDSREIPWHYIPVWITITTPFFYTLTFIVGIFTSIRDILKNFFKSFISDKRYDLVFLTWFFLPLSAVIILKSNLYDAWRLMFFIYPAFLVFSIKGFLSLFDVIKTKTKGIVHTLANACIVIFLFVSLAGTLHFMVKNHPFQNVYFNALAGRDIHNNFDLDYWGLSYRQGLEYILKNDPENKIKVHALNRPGEINVDILTPAERDRLEYVDLKDAKYFLSNYRDHTHLSDPKYYTGNTRGRKDHYPYENEFFSIKVNRIKILVVYKLRE